MAILNFEEKELHPYLVYFAHQQFGCYSKTIDEKKSSTKQAGENEWIHPDIVSFKLMRNDFTPKVQEFYRNMNQDKAYLYSFELKREIKLSDLKKFYFQAVSNSSWANEGYLVTAVLDTSNRGLMEELERLVQAFGIGVILLNLDAIEQSQILFEAEKRTELDFFTINKLIKQGNSDFIEFIEVVNSCLEAKNQTTELAIIQQRMDKIEDLNALKARLSLTKTQTPNTLVQEKKRASINLKTSEDAWYLLDEQSFTFTKVKSLRIKHQIIEVNHWKEVLVKLSKYCKTIDETLFFKKCYSTKDGQLLFLSNRTTAWERDEVDQFCQIDDNVYVYSNLSVESICQQCLRVIKIFNLSKEDVKVQLESKH